jgi:hypothetical protein
MAVTSKVSTLPKSFCVAGILMNVTSIKHWGVLKRFLLLWFSAAVFEKKTAVFDLVWFSRNQPAVRFSFSSVNQYQLG